VADADISCAWLNPFPIMVCKTIVLDGMALDWPSLIPFIQDAAVSHHCHSENDGFFAFFYIC
jgi:hypothetical protein